MTKMPTCTNKRINCTVNKVLICDWPDVIRSQPVVDQSKLMSRGPSRLHLRHTVRAPWGQRSNSRDRRLWHHQLESVSVCSFDLYQHEATYHADLGPEIGWSLWWELCCWDSDIHYHICSDWFKLAPQTRQDTAAGDKFTTRLCVYFEKVQLSGCWIVFVTHQRRGPHFGVLMMMKSTANLVPCGWRQHHTLEEKTSFRMLLEGIKMIN